MNRRTVALLCGVIMALLSAGAARAQVTVAPVVLVVSNRSRFGTYIVNNRTGTTQEVSIRFRFGYPVTDSMAQGRMIYGDTIPGAATHSMTRWVRAFPRQFVLPAGQQQTVRVTVRPPGKLEPGVYWTRIVTTTAPQSPPVDTVGKGVAARILFRLEQVTTLFYRNGAVDPAPTLGPVRHWVDSTKAAFVVPVHQSGNAPVLGTMTLRVLQPNGHVVGTGQQTVSIYFSGDVAFSIARKQLPPGQYTAEIGLTAQRADIPPGETFTFKPIRKQLTFTVPG